MSVVDSIKKARERGASDSSIFQEILKQNPNKSGAFNEALNRGADASQILEEVLKQNVSSQKVGAKKEQIKTDIWGE